MKTSKIFIGVIAAMAAGTPALAHNGDHSMGFVAAALHWLSSPSHSLFAIAGAVVITAMIFKFSKRKA